MPLPLRRDDLPNAQLIADQITNPSRRIEGFGHNREHSAKMFGIWKFVDVFA